MRILVAMSGGVDSSVAAALLHEQGHTVVGVHMLLHEYGAVGKANPKSCCGTEDALDARLVAERMGFDFDVIDLKDRFKRAVLDNFVSEYKAGRTPIPCTHCNGTLKFDLLFEYASLLDCEMVATGHYAQVIDGRLHASVNPDKDQSYFLWNSPNLDRVLFPVGGLTKDEVRAHALRLGLVTAAKPESMDLCFIPNRDTPGFLDKHITEDMGGPIFEVGSNREVGRHKGFHHFTVGQRQGLGVALGYPAYVTHIDADAKAVWVGAIEEAKTDVCGLHGARWFEPSEKVWVRVRSHAPLIEADVQGDTLHLHERMVITPGQAAVCYGKDGRVLGGGWIRRVVSG